MPLTLIMDLGDGNVVKAECYKSVPSVVELARTYAKAGRPDRFVAFA